MDYVVQFILQLNLSYFVQRQFFVVDFVYFILHFYNHVDHFDLFFASQPFVYVLKKKENCQTIVIIIINEN
jgi:hypothetical protein